MRLQDGAVRGGGFEITAGMQPDGVLEGAARIPLRGCRSRSSDSAPDDTGFASRDSMTNSDARLHPGRNAVNTNVADHRPLRIEGVAALHPLTTTTNPRTERTDRLPSRTR